jgi:hypothetical protein
MFHLPLPTLTAIEQPGVEDSMTTVGTVQQQIVLFSLTHIPPPLIISFHHRSISSISCFSHHIVSFRFHVLAGGDVLVAVATAAAGENQCSIVTQVAVRRTCSSERTHTRVIREWVSSVRYCMRT